MANPEIHVKMVNPQGDQIDLAYEDHTRILYVDGTKVRRFHEDSPVKNIVVAAMTTPDQPIAVKMTRSTVYSGHQTLESVNRKLLSTKIRYTPFSSYPKTIGTPSVHVTMHSGYDSAALAYQKGDFRRFKHREFINYEKTRKPNTSNANSALASVQKELMSRVGIGMSLDGLSLVLGNNVNKENIDKAVQILSAQGKVRPISGPDGSVLYAWRQKDILQVRTDGSTPHKL